MSKNTKRSNGRSLPDHFQIHNRRIRCATDTSPNVLYDSEPSENPTHGGVFAWFGSDGREVHPSVVQRRRESDLRSQRKHRMPDAVFFL